MPGTDFDAVSSIGLTEHVGKAELPGYFAFLYGKLRPGGPAAQPLHHPAGQHRARASRTGSSTATCSPTGSWRGRDRISLIHDTGFEVRHVENLREHYAMTLAGWCANLDDHWDEAVAEVGEGTARVWRLYMAGSRLGFERNQIQLHQILGGQADPDGEAGMPLRPDWEPSSRPAGPR